MKNNNNVTTDDIHLLCRIKAGMDNGSPIGVSLDTLLIAYSNDWKSNPSIKGPFAVSAGRPAAITKIVDSIRNLSEYGFLEKQMPENVFRFSAKKRNAAQPIYYRLTEAGLKLLEALDAATPMPPQP